MFFYAIYRAFWITCICICIVFLVSAHLLLLQTLLPWLTVTCVYFILSSVLYVIVAVCQLLIKDFLILILMLYISVSFRRFTS